MNPKKKSKAPPRGGKTESINLPGFGPTDPKDLSKLPEGNWVGMKFVGGKLTPGEFVAIDYSRGADNACVVLQPGQTREGLEKILHHSLEDEAKEFMEMKRRNRQLECKLGYVHAPGKNGMFDADPEDDNRCVPGSIAAKKGLKGKPMLLVEAQNCDMYKDQDHTYGSTKHWPDWAKRTIKNYKKYYPDLDVVKKPQNSEAKDAENKKKDQDDLPKISLGKRPKSHFPHPNVKWAQRNDLLFLEICLQDCKNPEIKVQAHKLYFKGVGGGSESKFYECTLEFYAEIDPDNSKYAVRDRGIEFALEKKECAPYWPRLLKENIKNQWLKVDFDKWVDEDADSTTDEDEPCPHQSGKWNPEDYMKSMSGLGNLAVESDKPKGNGGGVLNKDKKWDVDEDSSDEGSLPELE